MAGLTPAEHKVAELVAQGQSNLEIAFNLKITERTVKVRILGGVTEHLRGVFGDVRRCGVTICARYEVDRKRAAFDIA